jgi:signal transduction histidine kinase
MTVRPSVLLVDDLAANLVALEASLQNLDCELVRASSGNEALRLLLKRDFAVILLDVQMPEMDGFEVARLARQNPSTADVPIIFVTAMHETEEGLLRGYGSGAVDLLFKPVNAQVLRCKVEVFLDLYRGREKLAREVEAHKRTMAELDAFNDCVSHDLGAPLRPLQGFSKILLEDYADRLDATGQDYLRRIDAAATRMGQLIEDLLRLSRVTRAELRRQSVDLSAIAQSIFAELAAPDRQVEVAVGSDIRASCDPRLLRIVLENLLRNAWKFTRKTAGARIEFGMRSDGDKNVYFVADNGVGFDPTYARRLFQPFQRLHSSDQFEGTGIGLAIVRRIVSHHGGEIWAESTPSNGASFFFTLH